MHLREYLWKHKITIEEFAKSIGYNRHHISRVMKGEKKPGKGLANLIEKATNGEVKAEQLLQAKGWGSE
jgi:plasmid maintenance system antidote protein VapI